jgi:hypothetical protein
VSGYSIALRDQLMAQAMQATEDLARPSWGVPVRTYADGVNDSVAVLVALAEMNDGQVTMREVLTALRGLVAPQ